ncbi:hypothetical protein D1007_08752 [Hordeum vulgare]|nr:hypothetical protein D1007_08752 [Hordeum vulgare]
MCKNQKKNKAEIVSNMDPRLANHLRPLMHLRISLRLYVLRAVYMIRRLRWTDGLLPALSRAPVRTSAMRARARTHARRAAGARWSAGRSGGDPGAGARGEGVAVLLVAAGVDVHAVRGGGVGVRRLPVDERAQAEELVDGAGQPERAGRVVAVRVPGRLQEPLEERVVEVGDGDDEPTVPVALLLRLADAHRQPPLLHLPLLLRMVPLHDDDGSSLAGGPTAATLSPSLLLLVLAVLRGHCSIAGSYSQLLQRCVCGAVWFAALAVVFIGLLASAWLVRGGRRLG